MSLLFTLPPPHPPRRLRHVTAPEQPQQGRRPLACPGRCHTVSGVRPGVGALDHPRVYRGTRSVEDLDRHQIRNLVGAATLPDNGLVNIVGCFLGDLRALESACAEAELQGPNSRRSSDSAAQWGIADTEDSFRSPSTSTQDTPSRFSCPAGLPSKDATLLAAWDTFPVVQELASVGRRKAFRLLGPPTRARLSATPKSLESAARGDLELHRACTNGGTVTDTRVGEIMLDFLGDAIEIYAAANGGPKVKGIRRCEELDEARDRGLLQIRKVAGRAGREVRGKHVRTRNDCAAGGNASWTGRSKGVNEKGGRGSQAGG
ncbi:unnamed protein product [Ectocarpus sp. CCAP 1310/34]|nr:unnamed protein product [Ectocarpus sp. CCAP 1310/34]